MSDYHINIFYSEEDGGYIADIPDMEACSAFGHSPEEELQRWSGPRPPGWKRSVKPVSLLPHHGTGRRSTRLLTRDR